MLNIEQQGPILRVALNRPEVRNALNDDVLYDLATVFLELDKSIRAVVLSGEGKAFCAGGDLNWMQKAANYTEDENIRDATALSRLFRSIVDSRALVIAKIHGSCFGGGCGLAAAADVTIAEQETLFSFSEVKLGLIPATISPFVIDKIGRGAARWLFASGEVFKAEVALRVGLAQKVVPSAELDGAVADTLRSCLASGPEAVHAAKDLVNEGELDADACARRLARARAGREGKEGVAAFLEKRKPAFHVDLDSLTVGK